MKNFGEIAEKVGQGVMRIGKTALCIGLIVLPSLSVNRSSTKNATTYDGVTYGDAVKAVVSSSLFSDDKSKIIGLLKKGADSDYYSTVIAIVNSSMFSDEKVETIWKISK